MPIDLHACRAQSGDHAAEFLGSRVGVVEFQDQLPDMSYSS